MNERAGRALVQYVITRVPVEGTRVFLPKDATGISLRFLSVVDGEPTYEVTYLTPFEQPQLQLPGRLG